MHEGKYLCKDFFCKEKNATKINMKLNALLTENEEVFSQYFVYNCAS